MNKYIKFNIFFIYTLITLKSFANICELENSTLELIPYSTTETENLNNYKDSDNFVYIQEEDKFYYIKSFCEDFHEKYIKNKNIDNKGFGFYNNYIFTEIDNLVNTNKYPNNFCIYKNIDTEDILTITENSTLKNEEEIELGYNFKIYQSTNNISYNDDENIDVLFVYPKNSLIDIKKEEHIIREANSILNKILPFFQIKKIDSVNINNFHNGITDRTLKYRNLSKNDEIYKIRKFLQVDLVIFMDDSNDDNNVLGAAYISGLDSDNNVRSYGKVNTIEHNDYIYSMILKSNQDLDNIDVTFVHELGHILGLNHDDLNIENGNMYGGTYNYSKGKSCNNYGTIMSYASNIIENFSGNVYKKLKINNEFNTYYYHFNNNKNDSLNNQPDDVGDSFSTIKVTFNQLKNLDTRENNNNYFTTTDEDDSRIIIGGSGNNIINLKEGNDIVYATEGDDIIDFGFNNNDYNYFILKENLSSGESIIKNFGANNRTDKIFIKKDLYESFNKNISFGNLELISPNGYKIIIEDYPVISLPKEEVLNIEGIDINFTVLTKPNFYIGDENANIVSVSNIENYTNTTFSEYFMFGLENNDQLTGGVRNDKIYGGKGNDILLGGYANDVLMGEDGNDILGGNYSVNNNYVQDYIDNKQVDYYGSSSLSETINLGGQTYIGGLGNDYMFGTRYGDTYEYNLGDGNDIIIDQAPSIGNSCYENLTSIQDKIKFGENIRSSDIEISRAYYSEETKYDIIYNIKNQGLITLKNAMKNSGINYCFKIEDLVFNNEAKKEFGSYYKSLYTVNGTSGDDNIYGIDNEFNNNIIYGHAGNDNIYGSNTNDLIFGGADNDIINTGSGIDLIFDGEGDDIVINEGSIMTATMGVGNDYFTSNYLNLNKFNINITNFGIDTLNIDDCPINEIMGDNIIDFNYIISRFDIKVHNKIENGIEYLILYYDDNNYIKIKDGFTNNCLNYTMNFYNSDGSLSWSADWNQIKSMKTFKEISYDQYLNKFWEGYVKITNPPTDATAISNSEVPLILGYYGSLHIPEGVTLNIDFFHTVHSTINITGKGTLRIRNGSSKIFNHLEGKIVFTGSRSAKYVNAKYIEFEYEDIYNGVEADYKISLPWEMTADTITIKNSFPNVNYVPNRISNDFSKGHLIIENGASLVSSDKYYSDTLFRDYVSYTIYGKITNYGNFMNKKTTGYGADPYITISDYIDTNGLTHFAEYPSDLFSNVIYGARLSLRTNNNLNNYVGLKDNQYLYGIYDPEGDTIIVNNDLELHTYQDYSTKFNITNGAKLTIGRYYGYGDNSNKINIEHGSELFIKSTFKGFTTTGEGTLSVGEFSKYLTHKDGTIKIFGRGGSRTVEAKNVIYDFIPQTAEESNRINFQYIPTTLIGDLTISSQAPMAYVLIGANGTGTIKGEISIEDGAYLTTVDKYYSSGSYRYKIYYNIYGRINKAPNGKFSNKEIFTAYNGAKNGARLRLGFIDYTKPDGTIIYTNSQEEIDEIMTNIISY